MGPDQRRGVSTFLEVFLLIGVALGGAAVVFGAATGYAGSLPSSSVSIAGVFIRQGTYSAVLGVTLVNTGQGSLGSFVLSTNGVSASAMFCYSLFNPTTRSVLLSTCPTMQANPSTVSVTSSIAPGGALLVEVVVIGNVFVLGSSHLITVTSSAGAQQSILAQVLPT